MKSHHAPRVDVSFSKFSEVVTDDVKKVEIVAKFTKVSIDFSYVDNMLSFYKSSKTFCVLLLSTKSVPYHY